MSRLNSIRFLIAALSLVFFSACTKKQTAAKEVHLAIWGNYLPQETQALFTKETGIKLSISNFSSNEELLAKIQAGGAHYDVAVPSDYMVEILAKTNHLQPLDKTKLKNITNIRDEFLNPGYDPNNEFSLPYAWSTAGIAINTDLIKAPIASWKEFFSNKALHGKMAVMDDVREVTGAALKSLGFSVNTVNEKELEEAKSLLKKIKPHIKMFSSDMVDALTNKEVAAAHVYSTDALQAASKTNGKVQYILPEEGGTRAVDNLVILKNSKHLAEAHELINFLLRDDVNVAFVQKIFGGPVLKNTKNLLPSDLQNNLALFPQSDKFSKLERINNLEDKLPLYDKLWTEIKSE